MCKINRQSVKSFVLLSLFVISLMNSCVTPKKVVYFNDLKKDTLYPNPIEMPESVKFVDPKILPNDILGVNIQTVTQNEGNTPIASVSSAADPRTGGYLVDKNGYIELSLIGFVKVAGLTTAEAREVIKQKAKEFYKDPVVIVRILNFEITVTGDVGRPGVVNIPNERASIFDVIALSGELNLTANHRNVLLIRTENNERKFVRMDLTSSNVFNSPYFYVKQRDMIYVEPNRSKIESADNRLFRGLSIFTALTSIVSFLFILKIIK
jgi:polysaccharide export outer membrane protein